MTHRAKKISHTPEQPKHQARMALDGERQTTMKLVSFLAPSHTPFTHTVSLDKKEHQQKPPARASQRGAPQATYLAGEDTSL